MTEQTTSTEIQKNEARKRQQRAELLRDLNLDAKTDAEKATARLNRVQLFSFLTEVMDGLLNGRVLLSRPSPTRFWCQTGFYVEENQVLAKFGEAMMQPIGWDTGTEFWMTSASKFLWKHDFIFVDTKTGAVDAPFEINIVEKPSEDGQGISPAERENLTAIAKDITELLDLKKPDDFKRDPRFKPATPKAKWGPGELLEKVRAWLTEHEAEISARAVTIADAKLSEGKYDEAFASFAAEATANGLAAPELRLWAQGTEASRLAEEESSAYAKSLTEEHIPYTEEELDALAWRAEHRDRCVEALKFWSVKSRNFDDRMRKLFAEHPELKDNFENADILGLLASVVTWAQTALTDDRIDRVIRSTTTTARIGVSDIVAAEGKMASKLLVMITEARKGLGKNVDEIPDNDPRLLRAMGAVSQARIALPVVEARIQELKEVLIDTALDEIAVVLRKVVDAWVGTTVTTQVPMITAATQVVDVEPPKA